MKTSIVFCDESSEHQPQDPLWIIGGYYATGEENEAIARSVRAANKCTQYLLNSEWFNDLRDRACEAQQANAKWTAKCKKLCAVPFKSEHLHFTEINRAADEIQREDKNSGKRSKFNYFQELGRFSGFVLGVLKEHGLTPVVSIHDGQGVYDSKADLNYMVQAMELMSFVGSRVLSVGQERERHRVRFVLARKEAFQDILANYSPKYLQQAVSAGLVSMHANRLPHAFRDVVSIMPMGNSSVESQALSLADLCCGIARRTYRFKTATDARSELAEMGYLVSLPIEDVAYRRSEIFEQEGNLPRALANSLVSDLATGSHGQSREVDLLVTILRQSGSQSLRYAIEQTIDELDRWIRSHTREEGLQVCLRLIQAIDQAAAKAEIVVGTELYAIQFRARSYALVWANQLRDARNVSELVSDLETLGEELKYDVQSFEPISLYQIGLVEVELNELRFESALEYANKHLDFLQTISGVTPVDLILGKNLGKYSHSLRRAFGVYHRTQVQKLGHDLIHGDDSALKMLKASYACVKAAGGSFGDRWPEDRIRLFQTENHAAELRALFDPDTGSTRAKLSELVYLTQGVPALRENPYGSATLLRLLATARCLGADSLVTDETRHWIRQVAEALTAKDGPLAHPYEMQAREALLFLEPAGNSAELKALRDNLATWAKAVRDPSGVHHHQRRLVDQLLPILNREPLFGLPESLRDIKDNSLSMPLKAYLSRRALCVY